MFGFIKNFFGGIFGFLGRLLGFKKSEYFLDLGESGARNQQKLSLRRLSLLLPRRLSLLRAHRQKLSQLSLRSQNRLRRLR
jgi:hypothetical protein